MHSDIEVWLSHEARAASPLTLQYMLIILPSNLLTLLSNATLQYSSFHASPLPNMDFDFLATVAYLILAGTLMFFQTPTPLFGCCAS